MTFDELILAAQWHAGLLFTIGFGDESGSEAGELLLHLLCQRETHFLIQPRMKMKKLRQRQITEFLAWLAREFEAVEVVLTEDVVRLSLVDAFKADPELDLENIVRTLPGNSKLKQQTMIVAETLFDRLRQEGRQEGMVQGQETRVWIGKLQLLETLMGRAPTSEADLAQQSVDELRAHFSAREAEYNLTFKNA